MRPEEVFACATDQVGWLWQPGHVDKRRFKGACISAAKAGNLEGIEAYDYGCVVTGTVHHGWVLTTDGGDAYCGPEMVMHFLGEPLPEGAETFGEALNGSDEEVPATILDGPHPATWLEPS